MSARRSDDVSERSLALGSPSHLKAKSLSNAAVFGRKKPPKKEPRAKYCIKWLLMLYYKCSRLNGLGSPFGFETIKCVLMTALTALAKWPGKPVRV